MTLSLLHFSMDEFEGTRYKAETQLLPRVLETAKLFSDLGVHGIANDWLLEKDWKRSLAMIMFGDLLERSDHGKKIVEVGGSLSYISFSLAQRYDYTLIEKATHESSEDYHKVEQHLGNPFVTLGDWSEYSSNETQDLVIANDLFPNTDQRLYELVDRFLPITNELRLSLTYYEDTFFEVTRDTSGERLTIQPWGLREIRHFIDYLVEAYPSSCSSANTDEVKYEDLSESLFGNRRNIIYLRLVK